MTKFLYGHMSVKNDPEAETNRFHLFIFDSEHFHDFPDESIPPIYFRFWALSRFYFWEIVKVLRIENE